MWNEKEDEIEKLESEQRITESQLINANEEIERLKGLIEASFKLGQANPENTFGKFAFTQFKIQNNL